MKLSEIKLEHVTGYMREEAEDMTDIDLQVLKIILEGVKSYILSDTGLTSERADKYDDLSIVCLIMCSELHEKRQLTVDKDKVSPIIQSMINSHCVNLL